MPIQIDYTISLGNIATIVSMVLVGFRLLHVIYDIQFKVDMMWQDYQRRIDGTLRTRAGDREDD